MQLKTPWRTSPTTGWEGTMADAADAADGIHGYGVMGDGKTACQLGHLVL